MTTYLTNQKDRLSFLRNKAKLHGLTFKPVNVRYNGKQAYALFSRRMGCLLSSDNTIDGWYEQEMNNQAMAEYEV